MIKKYNNMKKATSNISLNAELSRQELVVYFILCIGNDEDKGAEGVDDKEAGVEDKGAGSGDDKEAGVKDTTAEEGACRDLGFQIYLIRLKNYVHDTVFC